MRINKIVDDKQMSVKDIVAAYYEGEIEVDNSFQRKYVWEEKDKIKLIETILLGYLIPEIFLWESDVDPNTGKPLLKIVDGQQRIGAIVDFIDNKLVLKEKYLTEDSKDYSNKSFSELSDTHKKNIWSYNFNVKIIPEELTIKSIKKIFVRLNMTNFSLNNQEIRNAQYNGEFIKAAEEIANNNFWIKYKIFKNKEIRRMRDVEFASEILIFIRLGIKKTINQKVINEMYDLYNIEYEDKQEDILIIKKVLELLDLFFKFDPKNRATYSRITHLYILIVITYESIRKNTDYKLVMSQLKSFFDLYKAETTNEIVREYREQSSSSSSRARFSRYKLLNEFIYNE